jgi:hypothetical protein
MHKEQDGHEPQGQGDDQQAEPGFQDLLLIIMVIARMMIAALWNRSVQD